MKTDRQATRETVTAAHAQAALEAIFRTEHDDTQRERSRAGRRHAKIGREPLRTHTERRNGTRTVITETPNDRICDEIRSIINSK